MWRQFVISITDEWLAWQKILLSFISSIQIPHGSIFSFYQPFSHDISFFRAGKLRANLLIAMIFLRDKIIIFWAKKMKFFLFGFLTEIIVFRSRQGKRRDCLNNEHQYPWSVFTRKIFAAQEQVSLGLHSYEILSRPILPLLVKLSFILSFNFNFILFHSNNN